MSNVHQDILNAVEEYLAESTKFEEKGVKASAARARKALGDIGKLTKVRRAEIQDKKNNM
jgi:N-glycosylase/DNA lyase